MQKCENLTRITVNLHRLYMAMCEGVTDEDIAYLEGREEAVRTRIDTAAEALCVDVTYEGTFTEPHRYSGQEAFLLTDPPGLMNDEWSLMSEHDDETELQCFRWELDDLWSDLSREDSAQL